jgi:hypothetical protein
MIYYFKKIGNLIIIIIIVLIIYFKSANENKNKDYLNLFCKINIYICLFAYLFFFSQE